MKTAQMFIPLNKDAYTPGPHSTNPGAPKQANQTVGKGFFTAPNRKYSGNLQRTVSDSFADVWSQPRLFYNSLVPAEKQFLIDAMRFENSNVKSDVVKSNVILQLNRVDNDLACRVARAIGVEEPKADPTFYHNNKTVDVGTFGGKLKRLEGLKVGYLATVNNMAAINDEASTIRSALSQSGVDLVVVAERLTNGVNQTYAGSDAIQFDAVVVASGAEKLFSFASLTGGSANATSAALTTLYPAGRPLEILIDGFRFGKPVAALGSASGAFRGAGISSSREGVYVAKDASDDFVKSIKDGLRTFKFLDRFAVDN